jgi:hypothetical protein
VKPNVGTYNTVINGSPERSEAATKRKMRLEKEHTHLCDRMIRFITRDGPYDFLLKQRQAIIALKNKLTDTEEKIRHKKNKTSIEVGLKRKLIESMAMMPK